LTSRISPVLKYPGSKWRLADWIIAHMPLHEIYLEPFFGSGAVFFRKPRARIETINDISGDVVNLFRIVRERPEELARAVALTPWARDEYYQAYEPTEDPLEQARRFLVRCWQGQGAKTASRSGWKVVESGMCGKAFPREWQAIVQRMGATAKRLAYTQIENRPAAEIIPRYNRSNTLIYADPPYVMGSRTGGRYYEHEMTDEEHREVLCLLKQHSGPVLISGYPSELYERELEGWRMETTSIVQWHQQRQEVLWMNSVAACTAPVSLF
jgi:DNA adenine methylase